jgi:metal-responsive CopG/Arc/MetJ family transcriptional regulator
MKDKTSITLSREVLAGIDRVAGSKQSRSAFIESVLREYLKEQVKAERSARDLAILNKYAKELNEDALDGLDDQAAESEEDWPIVGVKTQRMKSGR